jgi:hypothetical protein
MRLRHPIGEETEEIQTLDIRFGESATRALAPIERKGQRLGTSDRAQYDLQHQFRVRGLLALESPGIERSQDFLGGSPRVRWNFWGLRLARKSAAGADDVSIPPRAMVAVIASRMAEHVLARKLDARWISSEQQIMLLHSGPARQD